MRVACALYLESSKLENLGTLEKMFVENPEEHVTRSNSLAALVTSATLHPPTPVMLLDLLANNPVASSNAKTSDSEKKRERKRMVRQK